jgi:small subunit ribosomal protein S18
MAPKPARKTKRPSWRAGAGGSQRRRYCYFCKEKIVEIDYKNYNQMRRYISDRGKIRSRRVTGICRRHQNQLATAVKRAREVALLPYVAR